MNEIEPLAIIGLVTAITTATTTATTYVIVDKLTSERRKEICNQINQLADKVTKIAIRLGVVEESHRKEPVS